MSIIDRGKFEQELFEKVTGAADECKDRALGMIAEACRRAGVPEEERISRKACTDAAESALDEVVLLLENTEETGIVGKSFKSIRDALRSGLENGSFICDNSFRLLEKTPQERERDVKEFGEQAVSIGEKLMRPFEEQFEEIPIQLRRDRARRCKLVVRGILIGFERCLLPKIAAAGVS